MKRIIYVSLLSVSVLFVGTSLAQQQGTQGQSVAQAQTSEATAKHAPDVIFVPTPQTTVDKMLELAELKSGDVL